MGIFCADEPLNREALKVKDPNRFVLQHYLEARPAKQTVGRPAPVPPLGHEAEARARRRSSGTPGAR
jgi:hypothetical protein